MNALEKAFREMGKGKEYEKGTIIAKKDTASNHMYFVDEGKISVSKMVGEKRIVFAYLTKGDFFGEMSLISHRRHTSTIEAEENSKVLSLTRRQVEELLKRDGAFATDILKGLIQRLRRNDKFLIEAFNMAMEIDKKL